MPSGNAIRQMLADKRKQRQASLEDGDVNVTIQQENEIETDESAADTETGDQNVNPEAASDPTDDGADLLEGQSEEDKKIDDAEQAKQMDEMANAVNALESLRIIVNKLAVARVAPTQSTLESLQLTVDTLRRTAGLEDLALVVPSFESMLIAHQSHLSSLESQIVISQEAIGEKIAASAKKFWEWILEKLKMLKERILSGKDLVTAKIAGLKQKVKALKSDGKIPVTITAMRITESSGGSMTDYDRLIFTMAELSKKLSDIARHPENKVNVGEAYITYIDKGAEGGVARYDMELTDRQIVALVAHMEQLASVYYNPQVTKALEVMMDKVNGVLSGQVEADPMRKALAETMKGFIQLLVDVRYTLASLDVKPRQTEQ